MSTGQILKIENLKTYFYTELGLIPALDGVTFEVASGETVAIVGESGSGKSVTALSIMRLVPPPGRIVNGHVWFDEKDLLALSDQEMRSIRGNRISMIFQEPMTSLNPVFRVGDQIAESLMTHRKMNKKEAMETAIELLRLTGIPVPEKRAYDFPHQMSGGMRQRVMIAMALACRPELLIADEPTTALDVTIQAQILELMLEMKEKFGMAIILITHDLAVVAEMAERAIVMYCGRIVEDGRVEDILGKSLHPYTEGLLRSIPSLEEKQERLYMIEGVVPNLLNLPQGCYFSPRCPYAMDICREKHPPMIQKDGDRRVSCWRYQEA
ncbi:MAG TPA: ABC transporter ATP-binding protein [Syntrophomonadaceae bacterium]|nr:ABC transporter ATP-binding protein [Syntrophomonadaceae bacterium]